MKKDLPDNRLYRTTLIMVFLFIFLYGLSAASFMLIPLSFATLIAMALLPLSHRFERAGLSRGFAIFVPILIVLFCFVALIYTLSTQIAGFANDVPKIRENLTAKFEVLQEFIFQKAGVGPERQIVIIRDQLETLLEGSGTFVQSLLLSISGAVTTIGIILIYIFFLLYYRDRFHNFILILSKPGDEEKTHFVIREISGVTQKYLTGVITVMAVLAMMNTTGLLIIGVDHAIFFGVIAAMLNIIPYIGTFIGGLIPTVYALVTKDSMGAVAATAAVFITSQFIENNFLTPFIVGSKVKVNPLATIIFLLIGGGLWGVAGMILFIPFLGILKILFDNIEDLQPFGYLIGEDESEDPTIWMKLKEWMRKRLKK